MKLDRVKAYLINGPIRRVNSHMQNYKFIACSPFYSRYPVNIFHHIPKCGGESFGKVLRKWFMIIGDVDSRKFYGLFPFIQFKDLKSFCCLKGHYHLEGFYLWQARPQVYQDRSKYRLLSFVRDPLETQISKYFYNVNSNLIDAGETTLRDYLRGNISAKAHQLPGFDQRFVDFALTHRNYLAAMFGVNEKNYIERIEKYFFIGVLEYNQISIDILSALLQKPGVRFPHVNMTMRDRSAEALAEKDKHIFYQDNELDYLIYEYCLHRLKQHADKLNIDFSG